VTSILETGKDGYDSDAEFDARTRAATENLPSEWGAPGRLYEHDAVEVLEFVTGDFQHVAPILAGLKGYRILDLGCGYGRLAPFLSGFTCEHYLGVDRCPNRIREGKFRFGHASMSTFICDNILGFRRASPRSAPDFVWTSNVLQHLVLSDKRRLVETMKACRAPGGICLLREEEIHAMPLRWCEDRYRSERQPKHMIPVPEDLMREWFAPLEFRRVGGNVWSAAQSG